MADTPDKNTPLVAFVDGSGPDGTFKEGDDLRKSVKKTLADYISKKSKEENTQTIKPGIQEISTKDESGNPVALDDQAKGSNNPYAPVQDNPHINLHSDSGFFDPSINAFIEKGKDGHDYTKGKKFDQIQKGISAALSNNRFNSEPGQGFVGEGHTAPNRIAGVQNELGKYRQQGPEVFMEELQKVGFSLMLRAAGELKAATEGDPTTLGAGAASLIPGKTQLAIVKVDTNELRAKNAFGSPFLEPGQEQAGLDSDISADGDGGRSWGHLNTPLEPFDGFLPIGMTILGTALTIALTLVSKGIVALLGLMVKPRSDLNLAPGNGPFISGQYGRPDPSNKIFSLQMIGIQQLDRDFIQCVNEGLNVFFGFDGASFKRIVQAPGYYTIFVRNVIRSGNIIINDIKNVFTNNQNPIAAVQDFIGIVDTLKESKIIAFLNILAKIGDRSLEMKEMGLTGKIKSISDFLPENAATRVMKTRVGKSDIRQTTRTSAVPSKFLFSSEALQASDVLSSVGTTRLDHAIAGLGNDVANEDEIIGNRIDPEVVEKLEGELDSEYVPFYFHDLRTNEIVGLHAFLDTLEDNYTVNYNQETEIYGRVDPIYTYSNTIRNLTLTFNIVATSKPDFDVMWWKVNKLITMLYPQWSEGRQVRSIEDAKSFIQPFSQIPTASPFIRLRIGDLIKSNYSKFNLARLFGLGSPKSEDLVGTAPLSELSIKKAKKIRERMLTNPAVSEDVKDGFRSFEKAYLMPKYDGYLEAKDSPLKGLARAFRKDNLKRLIIPSATKVKIIRSPSDKPDLIQSYGEHKIAYYIIEVDGVAADSDDVGGQYTCTYNDLYPDPKQIAALARGTLNDVSDEILLNTDFFESESNAIARSFRSIQGKGLAGFITAFNMVDLVSPQTTWETMEYNSRAPKMLKINMSFAPVHDITPGIDSTGFNRAAIYPVGGVASKIVGEVDDGRGGGEEKFINNSVKSFSPFRSNKGAKF